MASHGVEEKIVLLLGSAGVGKSTYIKRLFNEGFEKRFIMTTEPESHEVTLDEKKMILQEIPGSLLRSDPSIVDHLQEAHGAIIFYDDRKISLRRARQWKEKFLSISERPVLMIQNKSDVKVHNYDCDFTISVKEGLALNEPLEAMASSL